MITRLAAAGAAVLVSVGLVAAAPAADAATHAKRYKNCAALNRDYPNGVGLRGAKDTSKSKKKHHPVTNFTRNTAVYKVNVKLDADHDKIACEKHTK